MSWDSLDARLSSFEICYGFPLPPAHPTFVREAELRRRRRISWQHHQGVLRRRRQFRRRKRRDAFAFLAPIVVRSSPQPQSSPSASSTRARGRPLQKYFSGRMAGVTAAILPEPICSMQKILLQRPTWRAQEQGEQETERITA